MVAFASLAGIPLTAGFMGKLLIFNVAFHQGLYWLIAIAIVGVAAGFYYYLKAIASMFRDSGRDGDDEDGAQTPERIVVGPIMKLTIIFLIGAVILYGVYPAPLLP